MTFKEICIATGKLDMDDIKPYYFEHAEFWGTNICFSEASTIKFCNIVAIKAGNTEEEAIRFCEELKEKINNLTNGNSKVSVIFENDGSIIAIGAIGEDRWIDVRNKFSKKKFIQLNIVPGAITVY